MKLTAFGFRRPAAAAALLLWAWSPAAAQSSRDGGITIFAPVMVINPSSNGGEILLDVRNMTRTPRKLALRASDFRSLTTNKYIAAKIAFAAPTETAGKDIYDIQLKPGETKVVKAIASNVTEAGDLVADLLDGRRKIGALHAQRYSFPLNVKLEVPNPDAPEISLQMGETNYLYLKNEDAFAYPLHWQLIIDGILYTGPQITIFRNSSGVLAVEPRREWFSSFFESLFRHKETEGVLLLSFRPESDEDGLFPKKTLPLKKITLKRNSEVIQQALSNLVVVVILLVGGACSLIMHWGIPNRLKQISLKEEAEALGRRISAISTAVDCRLRVQLRVERQRLKDLLRKRTVISADLQDDFTRFSTGLKELTCRAGLVEQIDALRKQFAPIAAHGWAPTKCRQVEAALQDSADMLMDPQMAEAKLEAVQALLRKAKETIEQEGVEDTEFAKQLGERKADLKAQFGEIAQKQTGQEDRDAYERMKTVFPGLFTFLQKNVTALKPKEYDESDDSLSRLDVIMHYIQLLSNSGNPAILENRKRRESILTARIEGHGWQMLQQAELLVHQMAENVYPDDLQAGIQKSSNGGQGAAYIEVEPMVVRPYRPVEFNLRFSKPELNNAAARDEWTCWWDFDDGLPPENGWMVWHYFRARQRGKDSPLDSAGGSYQMKITVRFRDREGNSIQAGNGDAAVTKTISVRPEEEGFFSQRMFTESLKLGIALGAAVLAMAGQQQNLLKLGAVPAMIALFGVGFAADTIKNLVAKS